MVQRRIAEMRSEDDWCIFLLFIDNAHIHKTEAVNYFMRSVGVLR